MQKDDIWEQTAQSWWNSMKWFNLFGFLKTNPRKILKLGRKFEGERRGKNNWEQAVVVDYLWNLVHDTNHRLCALFVETRKRGTHNPQNGKSARSIPSLLLIICAAFIAHSKPFLCVEAMQIAP